MHQMGEEIQAIMKTKEKIAAKLKIKMVKLLQSQIQTN